MFKCDQLIYLQLQKTGCSHIAFLLSKLFDGQIIGKHTPAPQEDIESNTYILFGKYSNSSSLACYV